MALMKNDKQETPMEWFIEQLEEKGDLRETPSIRNIQLNIDTSDYMELKQQAKEMEKEKMIDFALFHSARMKYALQKDNEFYANQTFVLWLDGENQKSEEKKQCWIDAQKFTDKLIHNSYIHKANEKQ
jgi:hypothetical protein